MGNISDNTQSRWGRRRPWIFRRPCAILPPAMDATFSGKKQLLSISQYKHIYALTYTMFVISYTALGFELSKDYDERTKVMSWRMYVGLIAGLSQAYAWCQHDVFEEIF